MSWENWRESDFGYILNSVIHSCFEKCIILCVQPRFSVNFCYQVSSCYINIVAKARPRSHLVAAVGYLTTGLSQESTVYDN